MTNSHACKDGGSEFEGHLKRVGMWCGVEREKMVVKKNG